jgi:chemotaxis protein MotB
MMLKHLCVAAGALATLLSSGCGIPEEQHQATLDELKKVKAEMAADKKACTEAKTDLEKKNASLSGENAVMKTRLVALGQDLGKLQTQAGAMVQDISQKEKQIADLLKAQEAARQRAAMFKDLLGKFKQMIDSGQLKVEIRNGRMIVKMSDKILFDPGKDDLKKEGKAALLEVTKILSGIPNRSFQVAGHTDHVPIKSRKFASNWELSTARAVNVVRFMIENGMGARLLSAAGYGEFDPVGDNTTDEGRQQNRRIEITLMPSIEELPKIGD